MLFSITFKIKDGIEDCIIGGDGIILGYFDMFDGFANRKYEVLPPIGIKQGSVTVKSVKYGYVLGRETISRADLVRLAAYISGEDRTADNFVEANAHILGRPTITRADLVRLAAYISGEDRSPLGPIITTVFSIPALMTFPVLEEIPEVSVTSANGIAGDEVTLIVDLINNPGIASFGLTIKYDTEKLEYKSASSATGILPPANFKALSNAPGQITCSTYTDRDINTDGVLFTLTFKIKDGVTDCVIDNDGFMLGYFNMFDGFATGGTEIIYPFVRQGSITVEGNAALYQPLSFLPRLGVQ